VISAPPPTPLHTILSKNGQTIPHLQDYILSSNIKKMSATRNNIGDFPANLNFIQRVITSAVIYARSVFSSFVLVHSDLLYLLILGVEDYCCD